MVCVIVLQPPAASCGLLWPPAASYSLLQPPLKHELNVLFLFLLPLPPSSQAEMFREAQDPTKRPGGMADTVRVVVQGTSRDDLNGQTGTIASYDPIAERYHVVLGKYGFILYIAILLYWSLCLWCVFIL